MDDLIKTLYENPITAGAIVTALAGVGAFFKPIMRAAQAALVRRIDQAWVDEADYDDNVEERVRRTAERVRSQTIVPLPQAYVETRVRKMVSESDPPPPSSV